MQGTIEEKVYHRQIFKQFLTNKILQSAHQSAQHFKRFFTASDMKDLFTLTATHADATESHSLLKESGGEIFQQDLSAATAASTASASSASGASAGAAGGGGADASAARGAKRKASAVDSKSSSGGGGSTPSKRAKSGASVSGGGDGGSAVSDDDAVMRLLFSREGVQSAFNHDKIVGSSESEQQNVESMAEK